MTDPSQTDPPAGEPPAPEAPGPATLAPTPSEEAAPPQRRAPGLTQFGMEGRQAPGLFVAGWLAAVIGSGLLVVTLLGIAGLVGQVLWLAGLAVLSLGLLLLGGAQTVERRAAREAYAGPSPIVVLVAVVTVTRLVGHVVGLPLSLVADAIPRPVGDLIAVLLEAVVFIGMVRLMVVGPGALSWREMGWVRGRADAVAGIVRGAVFAGPVILATAVIAVLVVPLAGATPESPLPPTGTTLGLALHLVAGSIVAPISEETLFRGFALTAWRRSIGARSAIVRTSIVFVLAHVLFVSGDTFSAALGLALVGGVVRIPVALTLGWLYERTGSIWAPIGLHGMFNGILIAIGELAAR